MIEKIDHIGIVVKDLSKAIEVYSEGLGLEVRSTEEIAEYNVKIAFLAIGEALIELIEPTGPGTSQDFLNEHGEGINHICYRVTDLRESLGELSKKLRVRDKEPRLGAAGSIVAFLDAESMFNVETELVERKREV